MRKKKQTRSKTHSPRPISRKTTVQPRGATRRQTRTLEQIQPRAQENHSTSNEGDRGGAKRWETYTLKQNQLRAQENHSTSNEGDRGGAKRGKTHTLKQKKKKEPRRPQYSQQRRPRETHSNHIKKDRNEKSRQRPYRYGHWFPLVVGKKRRLRRGK